MRNEGAATASGETFPLPAQAGWIPGDLVPNQRRTSGFRTRTVHNHQPPMVQVVVDILENHLGEFERFAALGLRRE
ncbi:MAG: hypothetical protein ACKO5K_01995 [Armatimonadota bacterium]